MRARALFVAGFHAVLAAGCGNASGGSASSSAASSAPAAAATATGSDAAAPASASAASPSSSAAPAMSGNADASALPGRTDGCREGMVRVDGEYCPSVAEDCKEEHKEYKNAKGDAKKTAS
ncbi:MAG TPA: hypothetical protein VL400_21660, partial [Polyangiaceae bacterium]|nr:hypothetical protein [Polyangiaceae bacterium]